jgi:hypothetical protein
MAERLLKSIEEKVAATTAELQLCKSFFTPQKLKKRQFLLREGEVCNRLAFVEQGALYAYSTDARGRP